MYRAPGIGQEVDILILCGGIADKSHVELAHGSIVIVQLRYDDLVDEFKIDAAGQALLRTEQYPVSAFPKRFSEFAPLCEGGGTARDDKQRAIRQVLADRVGVLVQHLNMPNADHNALVRPLPFPLGATSTIPTTS